MVAAMAYRSPLGKYMPTSMDTDRIKREAWHDDGILVVNLDDDRLDMIQREFVKQIGEKLFGKKKGNQ